VFGNAADAEPRPGKRLKNEEYILVSCFAAQDSIVSDDIAKDCHHVKSCLNVAPIASSAQSSWSLVIEQSRRIAAP